MLQGGSERGSAGACEPGAYDLDHDDLSCGSGCSPAGRSTVLGKRHCDRHGRQRAERGCAEKHGPDAVGCGQGPEQERRSELPKQQHRAHVRDGASPRLLGCQLTDAYRNGRQSHAQPEQQRGWSGPVSPVFEALGEDRPRIPSSSRVMPTSPPCRKPGTSGFSTMYTSASAAERVIVTIQAVATNPRRQSTNSLPC